MLLSEQAQQNTTVIFGGLPEEETLLECPSLCQLLGIERVRVPGGVEVSGIYLSGGFLIGGDAVYRADSPAEATRQDLELNVPWYQLSSQTKVYLSGLQEGEDAGRNTRPPLIWRNTVGKMRVFAVIGGYLQDETGLGILEGMMAESSTFDLYPVVNAQNLSVAYYPSFASENQETLQRIYSSGMELVVQNIIWPSLLSISEQSEFKPTCFLTPQFFYQGDAEPKASSLSFYLKQIKDRQGEVGWSAGGMDELPVLEKWSRDQAFLAQAESAYTYTAAYAPEDQVDALAGAAPGAGTPETPGPLYPPAGTPAAGQVPPGYPAGFAPEFVPAVPGIAPQAPGPGPAPQAAPVSRPQAPAPQPAPPQQTFVSPEELLN